MPTTLLFFLRTFWLLWVSIGVINFRIVSSSFVKNIVSILIKTALNLNAPFVMQPF